ncbi:MAG: hypothetical protein K0R53_3151 [Burkholderiales bacterium]|nr:hypothetical protein [Burkholderiales bacterium]
MSDLDLNRLREFLDEEEKFARSISAKDPRSAVAKRMLDLIADARANLRPSADGTANYVPVKTIIEDLATLRAQAEKLDPR